MVRTHPNDMLIVILRVIRNNPNMLQTRIMYKTPYSSNSFINRIRELLLLGYISVNMDTISVKYSHKYRKIHSRYIITDKGLEYLDNIDSIIVSTE